jgi:hypothetical protein
MMFRNMGGGPIYTVYHKHGNGTFTDVTAVGGLVTTVDLQRLYAAPRDSTQKWESNLVAAQPSPSNYLEC